ncbi:MAG: helix-turn-helix domain-containing protein [Streptosporangiaceae bacterium]
MTGQKTPVSLLPLPIAAERLGCSLNHVYRLVASGELPAVDIAQRGSRKSKTRVRSDDVDEYIDTRTRRARRTEPQPAA